MVTKVLNKKIEFEDKWNKIFSVDLQLPDGKIIKKGFLERDDGVVMVVLDEEKNIYLTKQWRPAYEKNILQIPAGGVELGATEERRVEQVHNELREELGIDARNIEKLFTTNLLANVKSRIHFYLATDLFESEKEPDEGEIIEVVKMPFLAAYKLFVEENKETIGYTALGIILAKKKLNL